MQTTQYKWNRGWLCCSGTKGFINFWLRFFDTRRETRFLKDFRNHTMRITLPMFGTSRGVLDLNLSLLVEFRKTQLFDSTAESPTTRLRGPVSTFDYIFLSTVKIQLLTIFTNPLRFEGKNHLFSYEDRLNHIYQPLRSGRIWHKVNFSAEFNRFDFRVWFQPSTTSFFQRSKFNS